MADANLRIRADHDWLRLTAYGVALRAIVEEQAEDPFGFSGEDAAEIARQVLDAFPEREPRESA
jgi:hypothetical protein